MKKAYEENRRAKREFHDPWSQGEWRACALLKSRFPAVCAAARHSASDQRPMMSEKEPEISEFKSKGGPRRIYAAFLYSIQGFKAAWKHEHAFRQELMLILPAALIALMLPLPALHKLALIAVLVLVLIVELINSAIEAVVDRVSLERHPLSKNAKDIGSAAVCLSLILAAATWLVIVLPLFSG
jgi:diacylglycerol kinase (ATP)